MYSFAISKLEVVLAEIKEILKSDNSNKVNIQMKNEIENSIFMLSLFSKYELTRKTFNDVVILPDSQTGYSEYRLMDDCESENRVLWIERDRCNSGDLIIRLK